MATCPSCWRGVQDSAEKCPHCGVIFTKLNELNSPADFSLPVLTQAERDDLVTIRGHESKNQATVRILAQADQTLLQRAGIHTDISTDGPTQSGFDAPEYESRVSVPRKYLLPAKVVLELHANRLTLRQLASQPILFRQKLLIDVMFNIATAHEGFKHALFPRPILAWYQTCANLTQQQMQTVLIKAPHAYRSLKLRQMLGAGTAGAIFFISGYLGKKFLLGIFGEDFGDGLATFGVVGGGMLLLWSFHSLWCLISSEK